ncbi:JmjC domain-containing protein [Streptomyces sp. NPDC056661]|uniref:JmjC domain-containing protein n=1 Tax=Streptomyces sp. NPDC056661 TaxID=3345898 RepID=UPI00368EEB90
MWTNFLEELVGDVSRFTSKYWLQRPFIKRNALPEAPTELLPLPELMTTLTSTALRHPHLRVVKSGKPVDQRSYTRRVNVATESISDAADPDRLLREFSAGATIVIDGLEDFVLAIRQACNMLGRSLSLPVHAHGFVTPPGETGFAPHHDGHDVFVVQVHGAKKWKVFDQVHPLPSSGIYRATDLGNPAVETMLQPGDVLYIPKGAPHVATAPEVMSVHVSFVCSSETWAGYLRPVVEQVLKSSLFQKTPNLFNLSDHDFTTEIKSLTGELYREVMECVGEGVRSDRSVAEYALSSVLASLEDLSKGHEENVTIYRHQSIEITQQPDGMYTVRLKGAVLTMPERYGPALAVITQRDSFQLSELHTHINAKHATALIGRLAGYGAVSTVAP